MTTHPIRRPLARVQAAELGRDDGPTDGQLLARFVEERDEAALAALIRRLGPAVLGVCRRVVGDAHLAEDAFQATFLVLVRRAEVIRPREQVGAWVYGVAYRVARRARAARARRLAKEQPVSALTPTAAEPTDRADDLLPVLDEELARLPDHYRAAVLMCDLEGRTRKDSARRLGIPDGTLSNRLAAARRMLARRLTRRGVTLGLAGLLTASVPARVSAALADTTARFAAGSPPSGARAVALAEGELKMMMLAKLKGLAVVVLAVVGVGVAAGTLPASAGDRPATIPALVTVAKVALRLPAARPADPPAPLVIHHDGQINDVAFSPDGKLIVAQVREAGFNATSAVKVWDAKTGEPRKTLFEGRVVHGVAFSPDGKSVATSITKFDPAKNKPGDVRDAFSCEVLTWNVETGKQTATLTGSGAHAIYHLAYSPDGKYIAAGGGLVDPNSVPAGGDVTVWDAETGKVLWANQDHKGAVRRLAFSADSKLLVTPGDDGTVRVWDAFTGKHQRTIDAKAEHGVHSAAFSPDGKLIAGGADGAARVWDAQTGELKHTLGEYKSGLILVVRFLPDGTLATFGTTEKADGNLKLWDVKTGKLVKTIADPNLTGRSMEVSRDGKAIAVGTADKSLVVVPIGKKE
jgi:RNA polymerase sigma factor (sigma-70 family)